MSAMPGNNWGEIFYNLLVIYLFLSLVLTCYSVIRMYIVKHFCNGVKYGKARIKQLTAQGRFRQLPVYSLDEIYEDKDLGTVRLSVFPNDSGEKTKYVLILPGGGYAHCVTREEGYPIAAKFNEMGYTAFVLEYRTGFHCTPYAPMEDVSRAIKHIEEHQVEYNIDPEGYALCGFSAGGNLAGIYAMDMRSMAHAVRQLSCWVIRGPICSTGWITHIGISGKESWGSGCLSVALSICSAVPAIMKRESLYVCKSRCEMIIRRPIFFPVDVMYSFRRPIMLRSW